MNLRIEMCNPLRLKDSLRFAGGGKGWCLFVGGVRTRRAKPTLALGQKAWDQLVFAGRETHHDVLLTVKLNY